MIEVYSTHGMDDVDGYTQYEENPDSPLAEAIRRYLATAPDAPQGRNEHTVQATTRGHNLLIAAHHCWSGFSEMTITNEWTGISIEWGQYTAKFGSMAEFFRALADADDRGPR